MQQRHKDLRADGHLDVLGSIPEPYRSAVLQQCERREFAKGALIWTQGEPADYVAFLLSGKAMSSYQSLNGRPAPPVSVRGRPARRGRSRQRLHAAADRALPRRVRDSHAVLRALR